VMDKQARMNQASASQEAEQKAAVDEEEKHRKDEARKRAYAKADKITNKTERDQELEKIAKEQKAEDDERERLAKLSRQKAAMEKNDSYGPGDG